jgi:hypothetical protein
MNIHFTLNYLLITLYILSYNKIKNYFYPIEKFTEDELKNYPIEIPLNELNNILGKYNNQLPEFISYINKYYNSPPISFNYPFKAYKIHIIYFLFFFPFTAIYILYKYFQLKKHNNFKVRHEDFNNIYMKKNLFIIKIGLFLNIIGDFILNFYIAIYLSIFTIIFFFIRIFIIKLYKHYIFISQLKKIHFSSRDGVIYINRDHLNYFINVIEYI